MPGSSTGYHNKAKKRFGQNFLIDDGVISKIIEGADLTKDDTVLEIGPGKGALTALMAPLCKEVIAVEIDWDLAAFLEEELSEHENVTIIQGDILKVNLEEILLKKQPVKVVANLPYYITTPIIMKLLESGIPFERMIVMVQKEVALRMCASHNTPDYGALSLAVSFYTKPEIIVEVANSCFRPVPKVDSAVVSLFRKEQQLTGKDKERLFKCIKAAFSQRRKTLVNALSSGGIASKEEIKSILIGIGKSENIRGEALSLSDFIELSKRIGD